MAKAAKQTEYNAASIDVNLGLDAVRASCQVYIGNPDSDGLFQVAKEPIDNALDEVGVDKANGKYVTVVVEKTGRVWVGDEGRGIPVEIHPKTKVSTLTTVMTTLSAGGKMRHGKDSGYKKARGVHGMGVSITCALATDMTVWTFRDKKWWTQSFKKGKPIGIPVKSKAPTIPLLGKGAHERGTVICYEPDLSLFDKKSKLSLKKMRSFLDRTAYFYPTAIIRYADEDGKKIYKHPEGVAELVASRIKALEVEAFGKPFVFTDKETDINLVLQWCGHDAEEIESSINGSVTREGGTHVTGLNKAIRESIQAFVGAKQEFKPEDLRVGLLGIFDMGYASPRFSTQVKDKLVTPEAAEEVYSTVLPALTEYWAKNKTLAKQIVSRAVEFAKLRQKMTASRKDIAAIKNQKNVMSLGAKLARSTTRDPTKRELFLVEGDSAGGTAKKARDAVYQEVLKLRGKSLNPYGPSAHRLFANAEVRMILQSVGYDPSAKDAKPKLRVGTINILTDPDIDGKHIAALLLMLFQRLMPFVFAESKVFVIDAPLFNAQHNGKRYFGASAKDVLAQIPNGTKPREGVQRIKGWGEVGPDVLELVAFNPKTRKRKQVVAIDGEKLVKFISIVGEGAAAKRELLGIAHK